MVLEFGKPPAHSRFGNLETFRGGRYAACFDDGDKRLHIYEPVHACDSGENSLRNSLVVVSVCATVSTPACKRQCRCGQRIFQ
jgi:hypothetical protein